MNNAVPFNEGQQAFRDGLPISRNPYKNDASGVYPGKSNLWLHGYNNAKWSKEFDNERDGND